MILAAAWRLPGRLGDDDAMVDDSSASGAPDRETALSAGELVLVAEDNPTNQFVIENQLEALGYAADLAEDGRQAFDRFQATLYGIVITDIRMPDMDGVELAVAIRDFERANGRPPVPIVALTADVARGEAERYRAAGIDECISKPAELKQLEDVLSRLLPKGAARATARPVARADEGPGKPASAAPEILDVVRLRQNFGADDATLRILLDRYLESSGQLLAEIEEALNARRPRDVRLAAHSMVGASRTAGADQVAALCAGLEAAMDAENWNEAAALQVQLGPAFARVRAAVQKLGG